MKIAALAAVLALAACGKTPPIPQAPTPAAVGAELATYTQLLAPISPETWARMQEAAARRDAEGSLAIRHHNPYAHAAVRVDGKETAAIVAYTSAWLAPATVPLQPMSVSQFLRAFGADTGTNLASVISPHGTLVFTREQLPHVYTAALAAGAPVEDQRYSVVFGARR